jgi:hypothetical protein
MPLRPIYIEPWGVRLHHKDTYYCGLKVPKQYLTDYTTFSSHAQWRESFVQELIQQSYWVCIPCLVIHVLLMFNFTATSDPILDNILSRVGSRVGRGIWHFCGCLVAPKSELG